jgi:F-type H+-transporting ATPase subunit gamma
MSGALLEIKKKIGGVKNTRKITKAMQLVAASKMRQFQKRAVNARDYVTDLLHVLDTNIKSQDLSVYTEKRTEGATLFVLYTSDKGLCGPLNTKLINSLFKSNRWNDLPEDKRKLITIGKKSFEYAKNNDIKLKKHYVQVPEKLTAMDSLKVVDGILKTWKTEKIKEVIFIAPHYKNSFTFYPVMKQFLPFTEETITSTLGPINEDKKTKKEKNNNHYMIFNPSEEHVLNRLYEQMIQGLFIQSFLELKASEYSSRMIAMQNATDSADRMIEDLSRVFNKARQAVITNEIAELMGGTAAVTD